MGRDKQTHKRRANNGGADKDKETLYHSPSCQPRSPHQRENEGVLSIEPQVQEGCKKQSASASYEQDAKDCAQDLACGWALKLWYSTCAAAVRIFSNSVVSRHCLQQLLQPPLYVGLKCSANASACVQQRMHGSDTKLLHASGPVIQPRVKVSKALLPKHYFRLIQGLLVPCCISLRPHCSTSLKELEYAQPSQPSCNILASSNSP